MRENLEREGLRKSGPTREKQREKTTVVAGFDKAAAVEGGFRATRDLKRGHHITQLDKNTTSFFVTNFPKLTSVTDLWKVFAKFGSVGEIFIPRKLDHWGRCFGFVKFKNVDNVEALEKRLEEVSLGECRLKVNKSRFEREENQNRVEKKVVGVRERSSGLTTGAGTSSVTQWNSFKEVLNGNPWRKTVENNQRPSLEVEPSPDRLEELESCYVGVLTFFQESFVLQNSLSMEGWVRSK